MGTQGNGEVVRVRGYDETDKIAARIVSAIDRTDAATVTVSFGPRGCRSERDRLEVIGKALEELRRRGNMGKVTLDEYFGPGPSDDDTRWVYLDLSVDPSTPTVSFAPTGFAIEIRGDEARLVPATEEAR
jgi:hypothetical protein